MATPLSAYEIKQMTSRKVPYSTLDSAVARQVYGDVMAGKSLDTSMSSRTGTNMATSTTAQTISPELAAFNQSMVNPSEWNLSNWQMGPTGWKTQPTLSIGGQQVKFDTPQEYISAMQGLTGADAPRLIGEFQNSLSYWDSVVKKSTPAPTAPVPFDINAFNQSMVNPVPDQSTTTTKDTSAINAFNQQMVNAESIESTPDIDLDMPTPLTTNGFATSSETINKSIDDYIKELTGTTTGTETKTTDLITSMNELLTQSGGKTAMLATEEQKAGVTAITGQLKGIQNEIAIKTAQFNQLYADIEGKPITMSSIIGATAQARKVAEADIGFLQAQALALQNNLAFAQQTAQRAVDAKYEPIEEELRIKTKQLELLQGQLDKEESIRADALTLFYNDQKQRVSDQKAAEKTWNDWILEQMASYPSAGLTFQETAETAQSKITKSAEYRAEVAGGDPDVNTDEWLAGRQFISDNADKPYNELFQGLKDNTNLPDDEIKKLLSDREDIVEEKKELSKTQILEVARNMKQADIENYFKSRYSDQEIKDVAREQGFEAGGFLGIGISVSKYLSSPEAREKMAELLEEQYKASGFKITE